MNIIFPEKQLLDMNGHVFTVDNDLHGLQTINSLRRQLKAAGRSYKVFVRGRGPRKPHININSPIWSKHQLQSDLPIHLAKKLAVYVYAGRRS